MVAVLIFSFGYSLFFELTQLSGLYGIYPYPYRFFEVDDLICNTLGGMLGYVMTPVFVFMLPKRERMDEVAYNRGQIVSEFRRIIAWALDMFIIMIPVAIFFAVDRARFVNAVYNVRYVAGIALYISAVLTIITSVTKGRTIGKALVNIRLVSADVKKEHCGVLRLAGRHFMLYVVSLPSPIYAYNLYHLAVDAQGWMFILFMTACVICLFVTGYFAIDFISIW